MQSIKAIEESTVQFIRDKVLSVHVLDGGHINETYLIETGSERHILQRLDKNIELSKLEHNYRLYSAVCERRGWAYPAWLKNRGGSYFYTDHNGGAWRAYAYINADIMTPPLSTETLHACGRGLAEMHAILRELPKRPMAVYPHLHDLKHYYDNYVRLLSGGDLRGENRDPELETLIDDRINEMLTVQPRRSSAIHGDPKLKNILFRDGVVIGFLDMDTVMPGSLTEDVADCIRSSCVADGRFSASAAKHLLEGYQSAAPQETVDDIICELPKVFNKINFELGLRYYSDAISKDKKFRNSDPKALLEKARTRLETIWDECI